MVKRLYVSPPLNGVLEDLIFLQNYPSMLVAHYLDPQVKNWRIRRKGSQLICQTILRTQPGEHIIDMCASPGGKTTHVAMLMRDDGSVIALDKTKGKVEDIQKLSQRLGLKSILTYHQDATKIIKQATDVLVDASTKPKKQKTTARSQFSAPAQSFDRVLLDPPCSGLGQRPRLRGSSLRSVWLYISPGLSDSLISRHSRRGYEPWFPEATRSLSAQTDRYWSQAIETRFERQLSVHPFSCWLTLNLIFNAFRRCVGVLNVHSESRRERRLDALQ